MKLRGAPHHHQEECVQKINTFRVTPLGWGNLAVDVCKEDAMAIAKASGLICNIFVANTLVMVYDPHKGFKGIL